MSGAALVSFTSVNLKKFLPLGRQAFGRNLAEQADSSGYEPPLHHMLCIAALKDKGKQNIASLAPYMGLFHAGFVFAVDERDAAEIISICGMPAVLSESQARGISVIYVAGLLTQWQEAVLKGCRPEVGRETRHVFNLVYSEFKKLNLAELFKANQVQSKTDQTFYLEYKR